MRSRFLAALLAASVAGASLPTGLAFAQGMDADTKEAKALFEDGVKLYKASKYEEARVKFKAAYGLKKRVSIVLNLAHAELMTSRPLDAAAHFREVLAMPEAKDDDKSDAKQGLADARKQLGVIMIDATGATVTLDGVAVASVPVDGIEVMPGTHTVAVKTTNGENVEKVDVAAGATQTVKGKEASTATTTTPPDTTTTTTPPDTTTTTPPPDTSKPKEEPKAEGHHESFFATVHPVTYGTAALTVIFGALWIGYYGARNTHNTNINKLSSAIDTRTANDKAAGVDPASDPQIESWKAQGRDEVSMFNSDKNLAITFGVLTGAAAAATVITFFVLRKKDEPPPVAFGVTPYYGGGASFSLSGAF